jgi:hypothetical protein
MPASLRTRKTKGKPDGTLGASIQPIDASFDCESIQVAPLLDSADGYYGWLRVGKEKLPYLYEYDGGQLVSFAGLWERWKDPEDAKAEWITGPAIA